MGMNQKSFANIVLVVVIVIVIGVVGYFAFVKKSPQVVQQTTTPIFQDESGGCGNIFVYKIDKDNTIGISVYANKERLSLFISDKTFEIGKTNDLRVEILQGEDIRFHYCNDVANNDKPVPKKLTGKSGEAIISTSKVDESLPVWNRNYKTTVILKDVHFSDKKGNDSDIFIDTLIFKDVNVGWLPG